MIAFRAPNDVANALDRAEFVTHKDRTFLLLRLVRTYLPSLVLELSPQFEEELREARAQFEKQAKQPGSCPPSAAASEKASGRARAEQRGSGTKATKGSESKPRKLTAHE